MLDKTINTDLNTLKRITSGLIQNATYKVDKVAKKRIAQAMSQRGREIRWVAPIIIKRQSKNCIKLHFICYITLVGKENNSALRILKNITS